MSKYPMKTKAPLKDYLWGGTALKKYYGKESDFEKVAESWELSCHRDGDSVIINGEFAHKTIGEFIKEKGSAVLGSNIERFPNKETLPVLIKLIDAADDLSVQVHPDNEYALRVEGEYGKTEMWYIVDAESDATLIYGLKQDITKDKFKKSISDGTLLDICNIIKVQKGDVLFIPAGTLHGIGKGIIIAEVQQNSNTTYRVFDYNRVGADGKMRELHIDKAIAVTSLKKQCEHKVIREIYAPIENDEYQSQMLSTCEYFTTSSIILKSAFKTEIDEKSFCSVVCLDCDDELMLKSEYGDLKIKKGESVFLEANYGTVEFFGKGELLITTI